MNPLYALINEYKKTQTAAGNLNILFSILKNLCTGNLFKENSYTPFNWYIIEKMPKIFEFYKNLCNVNLPNFIEQLIDDQLPKEYEYDYFKENPQERFIYKNICFNIDELYCLVCNMEKCKGKLSMNEKVISKIISKKSLIEEIKNKKNTKKDSETSDKQINYFLLTSIIVNENFGKIKNIKDRQYFILKELKSNKTKKEIIQNKVIKIKNVFFALLYNCQTLSKDILKKKKSYDIKSILNEIKTLPTINIDNAFIPTNFYINYLIENLSDLSNDLKENDYNKLLDEMESELTESLQQMNSNEITSFGLYLKETEKEKLHYEAIKTTFINLLNLMESMKSERKKKLHYYYIL
jgi:nucleoid DNA-binding protein